jgi:SAM-dependent methyltransferase
VSAFRRFVATNVRVSRALGARLPKDELQSQYRESVTSLLQSLHDGGLVVDVGGGKVCHYAGHRAPGSRARIVAVDISAEELASNNDVDESRVADVTEGLPFADEEVDLITARSVLEHLRDTDAFVRHAARTLKPGGHLVIMFPGRNAPSALLNRLLPESVSRRLVHSLVPDSRGRLGFPAHYDRATLREMQRTLARHDLEPVDIQLSYWQSPYFEFFVPLYLVSLGYEYGARLLGAEALAAAILVVARKRAVDAQAPGPTVGARS